MFNRVLLLLLPSVAFCFDAVVWSSGDAIDRKSPPALSKLIESATLEKPLVIFALKSFQLADFSRHANVYSDPDEATKGLKKWIASSKGYAAEWLDEPAQLPAGKFVEYKGELTALTEQPVVVVNVESFAVIDDLADNILQSLDRPYTAVLAGEDAVTTHAIKKRITTEDNMRGRVVQPGAFDASTGNFPIIGALQSNNTCLLYIGQIGVTVFFPNPDNTNRPGKVVSSVFIRNGNYLIDTNCNNGTYNSTPSTISTFDITLDPVANVSNGDFAVSSIGFRLNVLKYPGGYWALGIIDNIKLSLTSVGKFMEPYKMVTTNGNGNASTTNWYVNSATGYSYACTATPPAWIYGLMADGKDVMGISPKDKNKLQVGISFGQFQLQPLRVTSRRFTRNVEDCVPTFSVGSWMGILTGLVLLAGFLFAMTMLSSVQTMDRFDDPKQKQIIINFKE